MKWTRRTVVGGLAAAVTPLRNVAASAETQAKPEIKTPDGFLVLEAAPGTLRLAPPPASETAVWAYNGQVPGPLIRVKKGETVKVRLVNKLAQPTSLHWHGVRIANAMDGVAGLTQKPVPPGGSFDYAFTPPDAGLYWYHPHMFPDSAEQIGRGLYGLLVVDEPDPPPVDHDVLLVIDDWPLDAKGQIRAEGLDPHRVVGPDDIQRLVTVNSKPLPGAMTILRPGARVRLRLANVCAGRITFVAMTGAEPLVVAIDGQASEVFPPAGGMVPIGPGSRFELVVDLPNEAGKTATLALRAETGADRPLIALTTLGQPLAGRPRFARLPMNPLLPTRIPLERSIKPTLVLAPAPQNTAAGSWLWTINGIGSDGFSGKPLFRVRRGGAVTLAFVNKAAVPQQMHVHGHVFRVLHDLDDGWDPFWRESILVAPGKTKHVAFIADNPGKWALESLILDRQVTGMAGWFEVT